MKKLSVLICSLALVLGTSASLSALDLTSYPSAFKQGNIAINAGIGLGAAYYGSTIIPPISASVDYALPVAKLPFSFGALVGFTTSGSTYSYGSYGSYGYNYTVIALGARAAYHFNWDVKNLDTYAGIALGYYVISYTFSGTGSYADYGSSGSDGSVLWGGYIGARYFFTPNIGAFAEVGAGFTYLTAGLSIKI